MDVSPTIQHLHGRIRSITGTDPAAGAEISETVPARRRWKLTGILFTLATDAAAANRRVILVIDNGTNTIYALPSDTLQTASQARLYLFTPQPVAQFQIVNDFFLPLPILSLAPGYQIFTNTTALQAGDNYSAPQLLVEEWIDP